MFSINFIYLYRVQGDNNDNLYLYLLKSESSCLYQGFIYVAPAYELLILTLPKAGKHRSIYFELLSFLTIDEDKCMVVKPSCYFWITFLSTFGLKLTILPNLFISPSLVHWCWLHNGRLIPSLVKVEFDPSPQVHIVMTKYFTSWCLLSLFFPWALLYDL